MRSKTEKNGRLIGHVVFIAILGLLIMAATLCIISYKEIESSYHDMGEEMLKVACMQLEATTEDLYQGEWEWRDGVLYKGETNMEEAFQEYIDDLKKDTGLEYTLIMDKTRAVTTIEGMKGKDIGDAAYNSVKSGKPFSDFKTTINNKKYYVYYAPLNEGGKYVGCYFAGRLADDINSAMTGKIMILIIVTILVAAAFVAVGLILSFKYSKLMKAIAETVNELAGGNLALDVDPALIARKDELGVIAEGVQNLDEKLLEVIGQSKAAAGELTNSGTDLADSSSQASQASSQVTDAVNEVSKGAVSQAESVQNAAVRTDSIGTDIDNISDNVSSLDEASRKMKESCDKANRALEEIVSQNQSVANAVNEIGATIQATNDSANSIAKFSDAINDIASQTNLLSLNASIEAARAGEAGKGFAVVADEIRQLADQSKNSADEIKSIVDKLLEDARASVQVMDALNENIQIQGEKIATTQSDMNEMAESVTVVTENSQSIAGMVGSLNDAKSSLVEIIQDLSAISEENAASTQETNASMQELNDTFAVINESAGKLQDLAGSLSETISYFRN
ncbi:MAG: methyl-accepting chemotaxis protein [Lachnospiraceae bacterium]|nr:methyl-accepting chemotaxis protein [Lachnospiraceae bacterium]